VFAETDGIFFKCQVYFEETFAPHLFIKIEMIRIVVDCREKNIFVEGTWLKMSRTINRKL